MYARYTASFGTASAITIGLLIFMQQMIATGKSVYVEPKFSRWQPFIVERVDPPPVESKSENLLKPALTPPELDSIAPELTNGGTAVRIDGTPRLQPFHPLEQIGGGPSDGDLLAIVKVQPNYPALAVQRGLEGYVIVEFTVTRTGSVENVRVAESSHSVFERAAINAAARFRYRPPVVNGVAVEVRGVQNVIRFQLDTSVSR
jgi:protein TonB